MEPSFTSVVLVNHDFKALTDRFLVETTPNDLIYHLKKKVKETRPIYFSRLAFDVGELIVWKTMGAMIIDTSSDERMAAILSTIDSNDRNTIRRLSEELKVADLGLSNFQSLLVQLPAVVAHDSPVGDAIIVTKHCYLKAKSKRGFTEEDIEFNGIRDSDDTPKFVAAHERILNQKRKLTHEMRDLPERMIDERNLDIDEYFCSTEESSESSPIVNLPELQHIVNLSSVNARLWRTLNPKKEKLQETDAYWLLFSALTNYYENHYETLAPSTIATKQSFESWPFFLLIEVNNRLHTYRPKNDFLLLKHGLPRLAVEVNSTQNEPHVDRIRLMLQGASIVRFANTNLDAYKERKDFVFVAIYIDNKGEVERYLLYQDTGNRVFRTKRTFDLTEANERMRFALELYNVSSTWHDDEHTTDQVDQLKRAVNEASKKLSAYTGGRFKRLADTDGATGRLEDSGYEVVPDAFETYGDGWELINKPPPHVRTVYRRSDPNKTEYIAKHLCKESNELAIHDYLKSRPCQSSHIISLIEAVPLTTREWLILPMLYSITDQWFLDVNSTAGRVRLSWGLVKGLAYLHEHKIAHRDIKPENLVCDNNFNLKIIDFDVAIKNVDENMETIGYLGTEGWTAPEIGKQDGPMRIYSPIKADRWSCGRVILHHIMVGDTVMNADPCLLKFANQLMAKDPQQRPSLLGWYKLLTAQPISIGHN